MGEILQGPQGMAAGRHAQYSHSEKALTHIREAGQRGPCLTPSRPTRAPVPPGLNGHASAGAGHGPRALMERCPQIQSEEILALKAQGSLV